MPLRRALLPSSLSAWTLALALSAVLGVVTAPPAGAAAAPRRVLLLACDGAGAQALERAVAAGHMPRLAALQAAGTVAAQARAPFPASSAAGQAALWTGTWGAVNGIGANTVLTQPLARRTILEAESGFSALPLAAEPLFVTAARSGKRVLTYNLPQSTPFAAFGPGGRFGEGVGDRLMMVDGHQGVAGPAGAWDEGPGLNPADAWTGLPASAAPPRELVGELAGAPLYVALVDDPRDPTQGYDTALLSWTRDASAPVARLKPRAARDDAAWSAPVRVPGVGAPLLAFFRLFELDPAGRRVLLYHSAPARVTANGAAAAVATALALGGFVPGGAADAYARGRLGRTLAAGGDGRAEDYYLATARFALARKRSAFAVLAGRSDWDLMVGHLPFPDEATHLWQGYVTPGSPAFDRTLAPRLSRSLAGVYAELDALIGVVRAALPPDAALVVVGDHGMAPARWNFRPNVALRRAGLLTVGPDGLIDLSRTRVMFSPPGSASLVVNTTAHGGGSVPPAQVPAVLAEARRVLGGITVKTPAGVVPLLRGWTEATPEATAELGIGGRFGGQVFLDLQPGYDFDEEVRGDALFVSRPDNASGAHAFDGRRPELQAAFYAVGAGIRRGVRLGDIRTIDVAPTVSRLLAIPAPAQATGRALDEALAP